MHTALRAVPPSVDRMSVAELLQLFGALPAPALAELNGEYRARLLRQPTLLARLGGRLAVSNPLAPWRCKAFRPVSEQEGRGYNTFECFGRILQRFPMQTLIAPSRFDGKPAYQLVYRRYHSLCGVIHMVDEVRHLAPGRYLGIGTWGFSERQRRQPLPFLLEGPVGIYRHDIGEARTDLDLRDEVPGLRASPRQPGRV